MAGAGKQEPRHDDREINEMARRIAEQNRQKVQQTPGVAQPGYQMTQARPGQPTIQNYFGNKAGAGPTSQSRRNGLTTSRGRVGSGGASSRKTISPTSSVRAERSTPPFGWSSASFWTSSSASYPASYTITAVTASRYYYF